MTQYNTDNNMVQQSLWNFFMKYKKVGIALICIPILLSVACYFSMPYFNQAGSSAWLSFWGGYLGSGIMAGVTLYVLEKQLSQNHSENEANRHMQLNTIAYQTYMDWINKLQNSLANLNTILDIRHLSGIAEILNDNSLGKGAENKYKIIEICKDFQNRFINEYKSFELILINKDDKEEKYYRNKIKEVIDSFSYLIEDIIILVEHCFYSSDDTFNHSIFEKGITKYKDEHLQESTPYTRIWTLSENYNFALISKRQIIFQELKNSIPCSALYNISASLIKFETEKAKKILVNGTEQDK